MESDIGKLFIGGISWETTEDHLTAYFNKYGDVRQSFVMRDKGTGKPRGFAFVVFADPTVIDTVLQDQHVLNGRTVEAKKAMSRDEQHTNIRSGNSFSSAPAPAGAGRTKKIFVGGLPQSLTEDSFRQYFEAYGQVTDVVVMYDQSTQRPRGFGFVSFDTEEAVDRVLHKTFHDLNGKQVEVKRALPKDSSGAPSRPLYPTSPASGGGYGYGHSGSGGGGGSGGYYGGGGGGGYDSRSDSGRHMLPANMGGGFQSYGSGYGYGPGNGGMGYGGYGGGSTGYNGQGSGSFGNSPISSGGGYPGGGPRGSWGGSQSPSGFGGSMYGSAPWAGGGGGGQPPAIPSGQPQNGNPGYGYSGYGGYNGGDNSQGNVQGYGGFAGQGSGPPTGGNVGGGGEYVSGGYGNDSGGSLGYNNAGWRSDPSQMNYGGQQQQQQGGSYGGYGGGPQPGISRQQ